MLVFFFFYIALTDLKKLLVLKKSMNHATDLFTGSQEKNFFCLQPEWKGSTNYFSVKISSAAESVSEGKILNALSIA